MVDWSTCPAQDSPARDAWLLSHIQAGEGEATLQEITVEANGHLGRFYVFAEPLKLGGVRINASAALQQQIADALGCVFLTPRLADLVFANRSVTLPPMPRPITSSTAAMIEQSDKVGAAVPPGASGIVDTEGKYWVLVKSLFSASAKAARKAANYGWHFEGSSFQGIPGEPTVSLPGVRVIQGVGTVHNDQHTDYSQIVRLASRTCEVDGQPRDLADVLMDPDLASLVSHEGPLPGWRQPDVTEAPPTTTVTPGGGEETPTTTAPASSGGSSLARKAAVGVSVFSALFLLGRALARLPEQAPQRPKEQRQQAHPCHHLAFRWGSAGGLCDALGIVDHARQQQVDLVLVLACVAGAAVGGAVDAQKPFALDAGVGVAPHAPVPAEQVAGRGTGVTGLAGRGARDADGQHQGPSASGGGSLEPGLLFVGGGGAEG